MKKSSALPYVICHMTTTVDGKIKPKIWPKTTNIHILYEEGHKKLKGDAWIIGRTSMEGFSSSKIKGLGKPDPSIKKVDFVGDENATKFAIVIDPSGKCRWDSNSITGDHIIEVLTEKVSVAYLTHLQEKRVSYLFAGRSEVNPEVALKKLKKLFGIERLLLEGGGVINGSFLKADLIDELSQLVMPLVDGSIGTPTLFDAEEGYSRRKATKLKLKSVKKLGGDVLWLQYLKVLLLVTFTGAFAMAQNDCENYAQKIKALGASDVTAILAVVKPDAKYAEPAAGAMGRFEKKANVLSENDLVEAYWKLKACGASLAEYAALRDLIEITRTKGRALPEFEKVRQVVKAYVDLNTRLAGTVLQVAAVVDLVDRAFTSALFEATAELKSQTSDVQNQLKRYKKSLSKNPKFDIPRNEDEFHRLPANQRVAMLDQFKAELELTHKLREQLRQIYEKSQSGA